MNLTKRKLRIVCQGALTYRDVYELVSEHLIQSLPWWVNAPGVEGTGAPRQYDGYSMELLGAISHVATRHSIVTATYGANGTGMGGNVPFSNVFADALH